MNAWLNNKNYLSSRCNKCLRLWVKTSLWRHHICLEALATFTYRVDTWLLHNTGPHLYAIIIISVEIILCQRVLELYLICKKALSRIRLLFDCILLCILCLLTYVLFIHSVFGRSVLVATLIFSLSLEWDIW